MTTQHTPGPWAIEPTGPKNRPSIRNSVNGRYHRICSNYPSQPVVATAIIYGSFVDGQDWLMAEANARLIAAAPDLLEALKLVQQNIFGSVAERESVSTFIANAIAKAEGR